MMLLCMIYVIMCSNVCMHVCVPGLNDSFFMLMPILNEHGPTGCTITIIGHHSITVFFWLSTDIFLSFTQNLVITP